MKWDEIQELPCSVARALSVMGDRWTLLILRDCFVGIKRFDKFQKSLGLSRHRLSDRLSKLVEHEILRKVPYQEKPLRYEYRLTRKGVDLYPVLMTLAKWGDTWMAGDEGPPLEYVHTKCQHKMSAEIHCSECGEEINPKEVIPQVGPGLRAYSERAKSKSG
jgi:DNA-binding HxlR family transcriptional regulator